MKKERGVVKWFSRLRAYGYINPGDEGDDQPPQHLPAGDGDHRRHPVEKPIDRQPARER